MKCTEIKVSKRLIDRWNSLEKEGKDSERVLQIANHFYKEALKNQLPWWGFYECYLVMGGINNAINNSYGRKSRFVEKFLSETKERVRRLISVQFGTSVLKEIGL